VAETSVPGGAVGGPGAIAGFIDGAGFFKTKVVLSPQATDADPLKNSPTTAGGLLVGMTRTAPSSTLTRPANTTQYAANSLIASSVTAGAIVVPSFAAAQANGGSGVVRRLRLRTNLAAGMDGAALSVDLWTAAPTFNVGDGGFYGLNPSTGVAGIATGAASWLGSFTLQQMRQLGDGAIAQTSQDVIGDFNYVCGPSSTLLFWTLSTGSIFTPSSGQLFILSADLVQD
jgi:hypothetical protein